MRGYVSETLVGKRLKSKMSRSSNSTVVRCAPSNSLDNSLTFRSRELRKGFSYKLLAQLHQMLYNFNQNLILFLNSFFYKSTIFSTSAKIYQNSTFKKLSSILILDIIIRLVQILLSFSSPSSSQLSLSSISSLSFSLCQDSRQSCVTI